MHRFLYAGFSMHRPSQGQSTKAKQLPNQRWLARHTSADFHPIELSYFSIIGPAFSKTA